MKTELEIFTPFAKQGKFIERLTGKNTIIYTRVSSKEQVEGFSLETQKRMIEQTCESGGFPILAYFGGVYESAKTDERKEFERMLKFAERSKEKVSYIMVYSVDRFSRSGANAIFIANELRKKNIKIFAVTQPSDTFTATGKMQQNMQFIFSEYDNDLRKEKTEAGIREMLLNGYWCNKAPIGYDMITRRKRTNSDLEQRQVITINATGKLLRKAFYWKAEDKLTNAEILLKLKALGLKMHKQLLSKIFANPFYCGIMTHNLLNGSVVEGRHEKLIPKEIFLLANDIKTRNVTWKHRNDFNKIPLKNFLKCSDCHSSFCGYLVKKKNLWYYKCNKTGCRCNRSSKFLHEIFEKELSKYSFDPKVIEPVKEQFFNFFYNIVEENEEEVVLLKGRLNECKTKIEAIEERFAIGDIEKDLYQKFTLKYKKERAEILEEIGKSEFENSNLEKRINKYCQILMNLPQLWASNEYRGKLELQELLFPNGILFDREINGFRTPEINQVALVMSQIAMGLMGKNKGDDGLYNQSSPHVPGAGLEPACQ
ncbi:MAG: recombinase family protein [Bacteroidota bacterium]|nr:recombinase family protein [Bacteroidota bacterium]